MAPLTLISDGSGVYLCHFDAEAIDLVRGGQGVFGIAIGQVWTDVHATLTHLPTETTHDNTAPSPAGRPTAPAAHRQLTRPARGLPPGR